MSRRRRTKKKLQNRKPKPVVEDTRWYTIRCIVDKRTIRGELEYLVDWEDDIETGESYGATWVSLSPLQRTYQLHVETNVTPWNRSKVAT
jgi:hypothetical protein